MTSKQAIELLKWHGSDREDVMELYKVIEDELEDNKHNYKALEEFYNNSVAYATKIQNELNELKRDVKRYFELDEIFENTPRGEMDKYDFEEYDQLLVKLLKVGKE